MDYKSYFEDVELDALAVQLENWGYNYGSSCDFLEKFKEDIFFEWKSIMENDELVPDDLSDENKDGKRNSFYEEFYEFLGKLVEQNMEKEE